jgi:hypothetical protein
MKTAGISKTLAVQPSSTDAIAQKQDEHQNTV